jgi:hypothetical protein
VIYEEEVEDENDTSEGSMSYSYTFLLLRLLILKSNSIRRTGNKMRQCLSSHALDVGEQSVTITHISIMCLTPSLMAQSFPRLHSLCA